MPFFPSMPADAGPANVFRQYPELFGPWLKMSQTMMNGPSPFTPGEREMIASYVVGLMECKYAYAAHAAAAYAWGIADGLIDKLDRQVKKFKEKLKDHHAREAPKTRYGESS